MYQINRFEKQWDPVFLAAAFRLKDGQISPVIKTKFGYHIIQMVSRNGDDAVIRHILRIPQITHTESKEAIVKLDSIRQQLVAGSIEFGAAVAKYSDDENAKFTAGILLARDGSNYLKIDELDKDMVLLLKKCQSELQANIRSLLYLPMNVVKRVSGSYILFQNQNPTGKT